MLDRCAPGYRRRQTRHFHLISYEQKTARLQLGPHGKKTAHTEIGTGHVRQLARHLGILDCAKATLPGIF